MLNFHLVLTNYYIIMFRLLVQQVSILSLAQHLIMLQTSDDPSETRDLSAMFPEVVQKLEKMIDSE